MSILGPIDKSIENGTKAVDLLNQRDELLKQQEELFADLLNCVSANIVATKHNLPQLLGETLKNIKSDSLLRYKDYEVVSLDCRGLMKGDAYGWMTMLAKRAEQTLGLIVVIENIADIPFGPMCDDPRYVDNLLGHSWKNEKVSFGDYCIDRSELIVILTATLEQKDDLYQRFRADGYYFIENFDRELEKSQEKLELIQQKLDALK